jgi:hypothetical protein
MQKVQALEKAHPRVKKTNSCLGPDQCCRSASYHERHQLSLQPAEKSHQSI